MENQNEKNGKSPESNVNKQKTSVKKIKRNVFIGLTVLLMIGSGFIGAGAYKIFTVPNLEAPCPQEKPGWLSQLWDAVTTGTAIADPIPPPEPQSLFQEWWQEKFGKKMATKEDTVVYDVKLSAKKQKKVNEHMDAISKLMAQITKDNKEKIEKKIKKHVMAIDKLTGGADPKLSEPIPVPKDTQVRKLNSEGNTNKV